MKKIFHNNYKYRHQVKLTHLKYILLLPLLLLLNSCQDYKGMKQRLVDGYRGLDAYCFYVGPMKDGFPYLGEPTDIWGLDEKDKQTTEIIGEILPAFEQAGLLSSSLSTGRDGKLYPLYQLTDEGKKYYKSNKAFGVYHRDDLKDVQFCFGRREILDVTNIRDKDTDFYGGKTTETIVDFTYNLNEVPVWATHPALQSIEQYNIHFTGDKKNKKGQVYFTKKDGTYYNYGTGGTIETNRLGFYL